MHCTHNIVSLGLNPNGETCFIFLLRKFAGFSVHTIIVISLFLESNYDREKNEIKKHDRIYYFLKFRLKSFF